MSIANATLIANPSWSLGDGVHSMGIAVPVVDSIRELELIVSKEDPKRSERAADLIGSLLAALDDDDFQLHSDLLLKACALFFSLGQSRQAIECGHKIARRARDSSNLRVERRICNMLGLLYGDISDYASSMKYLQMAIRLARKIGDPFAEAACLANVAALMQEMGHYRQAIAFAQKVITLEEDSPNFYHLKLQCASNGLFASHRVGDHILANNFLGIGERYLDANTPALTRAFFERDRALYLIDVGEVKRVTAMVERAHRETLVGNNPRLKILFNISRALCGWAGVDKRESRELLREMYTQTKASNLYHHLVLQALIKVLGDSTSNEELVEGLRYAKELVEYTTSVKRAKFYKQLEFKKVVTKELSDDFATTTLIDPFASVRDWLQTTEVFGQAAKEAEEIRPQLAKHEELTAIHEDMARMRAATLRRDIRTDAVDTAENWAIAAEFFDDETGQHCYRVGHLAAMLARKIGMDETFAVQVEHAARLHDIGKIAVNELILLKPGPLDSAEMAAMRLHTEVGAQMLSGSDDPTLIMATDIARHHHEWWNGGGYPKKLSAKNIPLSARICAYADVYDALTHARSYKPAWSHERAIAEIERLGGTQFDPELMQPFCDVLDRYRADLESKAIPGFRDMDTNALIASRKELMETISGHA